MPVFGAWEREGGGKLAPCGTREVGMWEAFSLCISVKPLLPEEGKGFGSSAGHDSGLRLSPQHPEWRTKATALSPPLILVLFPGRGSTLS